VQIHVHEKEGRTTVQTEVGERELSRAEAERMRCDAAVCRKGGRNKATIPPMVRREVLARDQHRCQAPGCGRTRFLAVHHIVPRNQGGSNKPENLSTLCSSCHRLGHEQGSPAILRPPTRKTAR
jgi:5-methylcytosine-specific restriction endonuclease McrA